MKANTSPSTRRTTTRSFIMGLREMKDALAYANGRLFFRNVKARLTCWQIDE